MHINNIACIVVITINICSDLVNAFVLSWIFLLHIRCFQKNFIEFLSILQIGVLQESLDTCQIFHASKLDILQIGVYNEPICSQITWTNAWEIHTDNHKLNVIKDI